MVERGVIRNREYALQVRDFSGMCYGNIAPTDIDCLIEYRNAAYILIETKYGDAPLPYGQRLAFERLCDDLQKVKPAILIIASHECTGDIDVANTMVSAFRWRTNWHENRKTTTTRELLDRFIHWIDMEYGLSE